MKTNHCHRVTDQLQLINNNNNNNNNNKINVILVRFNATNFQGTFSINPQISNFMKIHPVGAEFDADRETEGQTDLTELIVAFSNFANGPNNEL